MIKTCTCKNEYMDKKYGKGKRVMNTMYKSKSNDIKYRCTVCNSEK